MNLEVKIPRILLVIIFQNNTIKWLGVLFGVEAQFAVGTDGQENNGSTEKEVHA